MAEERKGKLKYIPLGQIKPPKDALRQVDSKKVEYQELVDSVRKKGILNPIAVKEVKDDPEHPFQIIEGYHRFSAARDAGLNEIPAQILTMNDVEVWEAQIIGNLHKIETRPVEYAAALERLFKADSTLTLVQLAQRLNKSTTWLNKQLGLLHLPERAAKLANDGAMTVSNAYSLSALAAVKPDEVDNYLEMAMTDAPGEFNHKIDQRVRTIKAERRVGRDPNKKNEYVPEPFQRGKTELVAEMKNPKVAPVLVKQMDLKSAEEGFAAGVLWALKMDPLSVEEGRRQWQVAKDKAEAEKAERAKNREQERAKAAQEALANA